MNREKLQLLKNISAEHLSSVQIPYGNQILSISAKIYTETGSFTRLLSIAKSCGEGDVFLLSQEGLENFDKHIVSHLLGETINIKRLSRNVEGSIEFASRLASIVPKSTKIIIATGGGVICDISKMVACELSLPLCFVPSAPTSDGILSNFAVLSRGNNSDNIMAKAPDFVVCDASYCENIPPRLVRAGFGDVVSNYLAVFDWMVAKDFFARPFCEEVAYLAISSADKAIFAVETYINNPTAGIELLFDALLLSSGAMTLMGESTPCCGGEHALAIAISKLDKKSKFMHGEYVFLAFCKLTEVYQLFFSSYSKGKYLPPDTAARCDFLIDNFGISEERAERLCKAAVSEDEYKIIKEKYRICKGRYLPNIYKLNGKINHLKGLFFDIFAEDIADFSIDNSTFQKALAISPDVADKYTTLTLMREFGLLDAMLI